MLTSSQKAALWMVEWAVCLSFAMAFNKHFSSENTLVIMLWMRSLFGCLFILPFVKKKECFQHMPIQGIRGFFLMAAMLCTYTAYQKLSISTAALLGACGPIITILLSLFILKEKMDKKRWFFVAIGFLGVIIEIFPQTYNQSTGNTVFYILPILSNVFLASAAMIARNLLKKNVTSSTLIFYGSFVPFVFFSCLLPTATPITFSLTKILTFSAIGLGGALSQICYLQALKHAPLSFIAPFEYLRVFFMATLDFSFFNKVFSWTTLLSALCIIFSCYKLSENKKI